MNGKFILCDWLHQSNLWIYPKLTSTHLLHYDIPVDTSLIHVIAAKDDAYVLRDGVNDFNSIWPGNFLTKE